jgi:hypothetical protein
MNIEPCVLTNPHAGLLSKSVNVAQLKTLRSYVSSQDFNPYRPHLLVSETLSYLIGAVSRPRQLLARIGYLFSRAMQHRFTSDSHARIRSCVFDS